MVYESIMPTNEMTAKTMLAFSKKYGSKFKKLLYTDVNERTIDSCDIILCIRGESPLMLGILEYAASQNKKNIYFLDDDLLSLPKDYFRYPGHGKWMKKCLNACDTLMTSNQLIIERYGLYVREQKGFVVHTDVKEEEINPVIEEINSPVKIVYAAAELHITSFDKYIRPIMPRLFDKYGDKIAFFFVGIHPNFSASELPDIAKNKVHLVKAMPYDEYVQYMRRERFDIGLSPLEINKFTECKYFNKFLEYGKDGICGLYSDCMPYQLVVKNRENGYLVGSTSQHWYEAISYCIEHPDERIACMKNAQKYIRENHAPDHIYEEMAQNFPELITYNSRDIKDVKFNEKKDHHKINRNLRTGKKNAHKGIRINRLSKLKNIKFLAAQSLYMTCWSLKKYGLNETVFKIRRKIGWDVGKRFR